MTGIIGAMKEEINYITAHAFVSEKIVKAGIKFYRCEIEGHHAVVVQCGIGKVNAAAATQILIDTFGVTEIIFTGLAGGTKPGIKIQDFVLAEGLYQHDFDLRSFGRELGVIPGIGKKFEPDSKLNSIVLQAYETVKKNSVNFPDLHKGIIVSGDQFIADKEKIAFLREEFEADAAEMEGAAVAQVCQMNSIPYSILRTISDTADEKAAEDFQTILKRSSEYEYEILSEAVKLI